MLAKEEGEEEKTEEGTTRKMPHAGDGNRIFVPMGSPALEKDGRNMRSAMERTTGIQWKIRVFWSWSSVERHFVPSE